MREKILLYYIALNSLFIKDVLMFLFDEIMLCIDIKDLAGKTPTDYAFEKAKKAKKTRKSKILNSK